MTKEEFTKLAQNMVILDGATGSNLMKAGMPRGVCAEQWILEHEQSLIDLQRAYVEAGSQIVCAPTFGANRINLSMHGLQDQLGDMNKRLVEMSQRATEGRAYVAGDMSTGGKRIGSSEEATYEEAYERYREQITFLVSAGVDLLIVETMISIDETAAALEAAQAVCDLPVLCSMTVEADGSLFFGGNVLEAMETLQEMGASAVGINCSLGPDQLEAVVSNLKKIARVPVIAKPNAGLPTINEKGEALYSMEPEDFGYYMKKLADAGAGVIGGCCGTTPEYIRQMCRQVMELSV
ncbi:MAG: homocysteine S-methyltransferase family protein [Eubacteriales bacterium]|nr:homocysteine S-methyltransferase family protein [Eubacteriales bacterium]